jgi:hypothetical protein
VGNCDTGVSGFWRGGASGSTTRRLPNSGHFVYDIYTKLYNAPVPSAGDLPFLDLCARVQERIQGHYNVRVVTRDIPDPLIGDLDGAEIHIDCAVTPEQRLFLLAHLFGHTVQWNLSRDTFEIGKTRQPPVDEALLPTLLAYEREAAAYGLALLHETGIRQADQWLSDYSACDLAYLAHFYRTGEKRDPPTFWRSNVPLVEPRTIPVFTPTRLVFRGNGVVI